MALIEVSTPGKKRALIPAWSIPVPREPGDPGDGGITLRQLIVRIVRTEVTAIKERQRGNRLIRVLASREIEEGARRGKVDPGG